MGTILVPVFAHYRSPRQPPRPPMASEFPTVASTSPVAGSSTSSDLTEIEGFPSMRFEKPFATRAAESALARRSATDVARYAGTVGVRKYSQWAGHALLVRFCSRASLRCVVKFDVVRCRHPPQSKAIEVRRDGCSNRGFAIRPKGWGTRAAPLGGACDHAARWGPSKRGRASADCFRRPGSGLVSPAVPALPADRARRWAER
jgi:hypothetical protein